MKTRKHATRRRQTRSKHHHTYSKKHCPLCNFLRGKKSFFSKKKGKKHRNMRGG